MLTSATLALAPVEPAAAAGTAPAVLPAGTGVVTAAVDAGVGCGVTFAGLTKGPEDIGPQLERTSTASIRST